MSRIIYVGLFFAWGLIIVIVCMLKRKDLTVYAGFLLVLRFYLGPIILCCHVSMTYQFYGTFVK